VSVGGNDPGFLIRIELPALMLATIMCKRKCLFVIGSHHPGNPVATVATANENTIPGANAAKTRGSGQSSETWTAVAKAHIYLSHGVRDSWDALTARESQSIGRVYCDHDE
jgi:hypothetical protein